MDILKIKEHDKMGFHPQSSCIKGDHYGLPLLFYPSQAKQFSSIALAAMSPRNTDSVLI